MYYIIEKNQTNFNFSKTKAEKEATKRVIASHKKELRDFYGKDIMANYGHKIMNVDKTLRDEFKTILLKRFKSKGGIVLNLTK